MLQRAISVSIFHPYNRKERKKILQKIGLKKLISNEVNGEQRKILEDDDYDDVYDGSEGSLHFDEDYDTKEVCKFSIDPGFIKKGSDLANPYREGFLTLFTCGSERYEALGLSLLGILTESLIDSLSTNKAENHHPGPDIDAEYPGPDINTEFLSPVSIVNSVLRTIGILPSKQAIVKDLNRRISLVGIDKDQGLSPITEQMVYDGIKDLNDAFLPADSPQGAVLYTYPDNDPIQDNFAVHKIRFDDESNPDPGSGLKSDSDESDPSPTSTTYPGPGAESDPCSSSNLDLGPRKSNPGLDDQFNPGLGFKSDPNESDPGLNVPLESMEDELNEMKISRGVIEDSNIINITTNIKKGEHVCTYMYRYLFMHL
jgi:hypothetical protein